MSRRRYQYRFYFIYKTTNLVTEKIYVGQRSTNDLNDSYLGSGKYFLNALKKYKKENFKREILEFCQDQEELDRQERFWIAKFHTQDKKIGYNIGPGGDGGSMFGKYHSETSKQKMSESHKGKKVVFSEEHKRKLREAARFKLPVSEETRRKISKSHKGRIFSEEHKRKISESNKGKKVTDEFCKRMSLINSGRVVSQETRKKMSEDRKRRGVRPIRKDYTVSEVTRKKISQSKRGRAVSKEVLERLLYYSKLRSEKSKFLKLSKVA